MPRAPRGHTPPATSNLCVSLLRIRCVEERRAAFSSERKALGTSGHVPSDLVQRGWWVPQKGALSKEGRAGVGKRVCSQQAG